METIPSTLIGANFTVQPHFIPGAKHGTIVFRNRWSLSIVAGPSGCGLHGDIADGTFEVAVIDPAGDIVGNVFEYQTASEVRCIAHVIAAR